MIRSFEDDGTEALLAGRFNRRLQQVARVAQRKLRQLHAARELRDLSALPGNRLEALARDRRGQHSIQVTISTVSTSSGRMATRRTWRSSTPTDVRGETMAKSRRLPPVHPGEILREDLIVARYFSTTAEFWVTLQSAYDLDVATRASAERN